MRFLFRAQSSAAEQFKQLVSHLFQIHSYANKAAPASGWQLLLCMWMWLWMWLCDCECDCYSNCVTVSVVKLSKQISADDRCIRWVYGYGTSPSQYRHRVIHIHQKTEPLIDVNAKTTGKKVLQNGEDKAEWTETSFDCLLHCLLIMNSNGDQYRLMLIQRLTENSNSIL